MLKIIFVSSKKLTFKVDKVKVYVYIHIHRQKVTKKVVNKAYTVPNPGKK